MEYWRVGILTNGYDGQGVVARFEYQSINQNVIPGTQSGKILTIEILCKQKTKILVTLIGQGFFHGYIELTTCIMSPAMSASYFYRHFGSKIFCFQNWFFLFRRHLWVSLVWSGSTNEPWNMQYVMSCYLLKSIVAMMMTWGGTWRCWWCPGRWQGLQRCIPLERLSTCGPPRSSSEYKDGGGL